MSAIVCGKRSLFEELPTTPLMSKRFRCSSTSPIRLSPPPNYNPFCAQSADFSIDRLRALFPGMDEKFLETALEESGDLESAIKSLTELRLVSAKRNFTSQGIEVNSGGVTPEDLSIASNLPQNGAEWVEHFVKEMTCASDLDDARARASRVLEVLEKFIRTQDGANATENLQKENVELKEQMEVLLRENSILKRAVAIQHDRQKEADSNAQELQHLKTLVTQYQERLRTLEVNNYALTLHLREAQQSSSIPGRYHPDIF